MTVSQGQPGPVLAIEPTPAKNCMVLSVVDGNSNTRASWRARNPRVFILLFFFFFQCARTPLTEARQRGGCLPIQPWLSSKCNNEEVNFGSNLFCTTPHQWHHLVLARALASRHPVPHSLDPDPASPPPLQAPHWPKSVRPWPK